MEFRPEDLSLRETLKKTRSTGGIPEEKSVGPITSMDDCAPAIILGSGKAVSRERDPRKSVPPLLRDTTNFSVLDDSAFRMYYIARDVNYFNPGVGAWLPPGCYTGIFPRLIFDLVSRPLYDLPIGTTATILR